MSQLLWIFSLLALPFSVYGQTSNIPTNHLAISQGIASPAVTHTSLFSNGFTYENPVAVSYQNSYRITGTADGQNSTSFGLDVGVGDTQYGVSLGVYSNGCDGCDAYVRGNLSAIWGAFGLGFAVQEDVYTMGMLLNPNGLHRFGMVIEFDEPGGYNNNRGAIGFGYAYVLPQFTFSIDMSKQSYESDTTLDDPLMVTPGIAVRVDVVSVSVSYDLFLNNGANNFTDSVWVGIGINAFSDFEFAFYGEYNDRWTLTGTYYF